MKYTWEMIIKAEQEQMERQEIQFCPARRFSPYMELNFEHINDTSVQQKVDVNPYYRYYDIFKDYFNPDMVTEEIQKVLFDLILHFLGKQERYLGMTKREYYIEFVISDIEDGLFGGQVQRDFGILNEQEKKIIAGNILRLYMTGEGVYLFLDTVRRLFEKATVLANAREKDMIILFLSTEETPERIKKMNLLKLLFLPFKYEMEIYWEYLFGVIGVDKLMGQEKMIIY